MGLLDLDDGEFTEIISAGEEAVGRIVEPLSDIRLTDDPTRARNGDGELVVSEDRARVDSPKGETLYAAPDPQSSGGAQVRVDGPDGRTKIRREPRRVIERPADAATREGNLASFTEDDTVPAGGGQRTAPSFNQTEPIVIERIAVIDKTNTVEKFQAQLEISGSGRVAAFNGLTESGRKFDPGFRVPANEFVRLQITNNDGSNNMEVRGIVVFRVTD